MVLQQNPFSIFRMRAMCFRKDLRISEESWGHVEVYNHRSLSKYDFQIYN